MFIDAHAHLSMPVFARDLDQVLARAREAGVTGIMSCATSLSDAERNLQVVREHRGQGLLASVGFHPHQASRWTDESESRLGEMIAASPEIAGIGEVGLDFHYNFSPPETQCDVLRRQVRLARSVRLPLIIHCRNAREELKQILLEEGARDAGGMLHCFSEDADFARFCLEEGFYISFSGIITFKKADAIRQTARCVPLDRLLVETDSPYLAPSPHRGRRNEPALVLEVARALAELRQIAAEEIRAATAANFATLFAHRPAP